MARPYRLQGEGLLYHITSCGDDRKKIFLNETGYQRFLEYLKSAKVKFKSYLYAFCLMGNHCHLLLGTTQSNLSRIIQSLNTVYTVYYVGGRDYARRKMIESMDPSMIIHKVAEYYDQPIENLRNAKKRPLLAKKIAVYLLKKLTALTNTEISREFGIGYSGVSWVA